ncbi:MAG: LptF/LptG family permease [Prevotellaceae bacterium]|nr:LptF/LptG family permease [Candidatus Colivivens caballi]
MKIRRKKLNKYTEWITAHSPVNRLDRYIIGKFLGTYFFSIALIISIAVVFDFNENIDRFLSNNAPVSAILFDYYLNFIPYYSNLFSQLFVFISVIFFTSKLAENSEIIAMMSTGMSFPRLMRPYMISAAIICALTFVLGAYIIPQGNVKRVRFENTFKRKRLQTYTTNVQLQVEDGVIAYIDQYEDNVKTGYFFTLDKFVNKKLVSHLQSSIIQYDSLSEEPYHWILKNYQERDLQGMREKITSGARLDTIIRMEPQDFLINKGQQQTLTTPKLSEYIERQKARGFANIKEFQVEYWQRGASSFAAFILTAIGLCLSAKKRKNGMGISLGIGLGLSVTYILFQTISATFAINANVPPIIAAWIPNFVFALIAVYCYRFAPK